MTPLLVEMKRVSANLKTEAAGEDAEIMTVPTLARYLHCNKATIYRLLKKKQIPAFRIGTDWRFFRSAIDQWIAQHEITPVTRGHKPKVS